MAVHVVPGSRAGGAGHRTHAPVLASQRPSSHVTPLSTGGRIFHRGHGGGCSRLSAPSHSSWAFWRTAPATSVLVVDSSAPVVYSSGYRATECSGRDALIWIGVASAVLGVALLAIGIATRTTPAAVVGGLALGGGALAIGFGACHCISSSNRQSQAAPRQRVERDDNDALNPAANI